MLDFSGETGAGMNLVEKLLPPPKAIITANGDRNNQHIYTVD